jgi:hypothetical protein
LTNIWVIVVSSREIQHIGDQRLRRGEVGLVSGRLREPSKHVCGVAVRGDGFERQCLISTRQAEVGTDCCCDLSPGQRVSTNLDAPALDGRTALQDRGSSAPDIPHRHHLKLDAVGQRQPNDEHTVFDADTKSGEVLHEEHRPQERGMDSQ